MAIIPYELWLEACRNWDLLETGVKPSWPKFPKSLNVFLEWHTDATCYAGILVPYPDRKKVVVAEHTVAKFRMLASPDFRLLYKIYCLQHEERLTMGQIKAYKMRTAPVIS